jgi:hypothetical protein
MFTLIDSPSIKKACSLLMSVVLALGMTVPAAAFADKPQQTDSPAAAGAVSDAADETAVDISSEWSKGSLSLTEGGHYYLSSDVQTPGTLTISAPADEEISIDFQGHKATIKGAVTAGIDVSSSKGKVVLYDSAANVASGENPQAGLSVAANKAEEVTCGILANYEPVVAGVENDAPAVPSLEVHNLFLDAEVNTVNATSNASKFDCYGIYAGYADSDDARDSLSAVFDGCKVSSKVSMVSLNEQSAKELLSEYGEKVLEESSCGLSAGFYFAEKGARLLGKTQVSTSSAGEACDIYCRQAPGFGVGEGFSASNLTVYANGNVDGSPFATVDEGIQVSEGAFVSAIVPDSLKCSSGAGVLLFASAVGFGDDNQQGNDAQAVALASSEAVAVSDSADEWVEITQENSNELTSIYFEDGDPKDYRFKLTEDINLDGYINPDEECWNEESGEGLNLTIDLNGHTLTFGENKNINFGDNGFDEGFESLAIVSNASEKGRLVFSGATSGITVTSGTGSFELRNVCIEKKYSSEITNSLGFGGIQQASLTGTALLINAEKKADDWYTTEGQDFTYKINDSEIVYDASNLVKTTSGYQPNVSAITVVGDKAELEKVEIANSTFTCMAPAHLTYASVSEEQPVNAYGIYTACKENAFGNLVKLNVSESSCNVTAPSGAAVGIGLQHNQSIWQPNYKTTIAEASLSEMSFVLRGKTGSFGIEVAENAEKGGVNLDGGFSYDAVREGDSSDYVSAFIKSDAEQPNSIKIGSEFKSNSGALPLMVGSTLALANAGGTKVFSFADGFEPTEDQLVTIKASFKGIGDSTSDDLTVTADGLSFAKIDESTCGAYLVGSDGAIKDYYRTFAQTNAAAASGDTIKLKASKWSGDALEFVPTTEEKASSDAGGLSYAVDLNGASVKEFKCSSKAKVTLRSSNEGGQVLTGAVDEGYTTAVSITDGGSLTLDPSVSVDVNGAVSVRAVSVKNGTFNVLPLAAVTDGSSAATIKATGNSGIDVMGIYAGSNATVNLTGASVEVKSSNGLANGIYLLGGSNSSATLTGSSVTALGNGIAKKNAGVAGIYANGSGTFTATNSTIKAESSDCSVATSYSAGLYVAGKDVSLTGCTVAESTSGSYSPLKEAGIYENKPSIGSSGTLTLAGESKISSNAEHSDIAGLDNAIELKSNFASEKAIKTQLASGFSDDFAKRPEGDSAKFDDTQKNLFSVMFDGEAQGLRINATNNVLELDRDLVAKIGSTPYYSLSKAISSAKDGETISLEGDWSILTSKESLDFTSSATRNITLDLNGKTLSVTGSSQGFSTSTDAVIVPASGGLKVTDSAKSGKLVLNSANRGFRVGAGSSLVLDGANVEVQYNGKVSYVYGGTQGSIVGIGSDGTAWKNVALQNGANLTVSSMGASALSGGFTGATQAYGIALPSGAAGSTSSSVLSIDSSSSVNVENSSALFTAGSVASGTEDAKLANLREVNLSENSELYNSIWDEFFKSAKYDSTRGIYYAAPVKVNGVNYWVVSDKVENQKGTKDEVKPSKVYQRATYQVAPVATGIYSGNALSSATFYNGTVSVLGTVSAVSQNGNAYAVEAGDSAAWNINGATLSAQSKAASAYRGKSEENHELYPGSQNTEIVDVAPQAAALKTGNPKQNFVLGGEVGVSSSIAFKGTVSEEVNCASADIIADSVTCGSSLGLKDEANAISVLAINGKNEKGSAFAKAAAEGDSLSGVAGLFEDATGTYGSVAATDGSLVWGGSYTVRFVDAYGNVVSETAEVTDGTTVALPDANKLFRDRDGVYVYAFLGWSTKKDATEASVSAESATMQFASGGVAEQTITYYPVYSAAHYQATASFANLHSATGDLANGTGTASATIDTGKTVKQAIDENALDLSFAQTYEKDGKKYVFVGWKVVGINGYNDMCGGSLDDGAMRNIELSGNATFTATYVTVESGQYLAKFKVGNIVFAYAENEGTAPSWKSCGYTENASGTNYPSGLILERVKPEGVGSLTFNGWHTGSSDSLTVPDGQKVDYTKDATLAGAQAGGTVMYTAWFDTISSTYAVKLYLYQQGADGKFAFPRTAYSTTGSGYCSATYGIEPSSLVKDLPKSFVQDGKTYTFKGWSVRETDTEPIWEDGNLPKVTGDATYYAVYEESAQKVNVTFVNGNDTYKEVEGVEVSKSLDDLAVENPQVADANQEFKGWSTQPGATSGMNASASLQELLGNSLTADTTQVTFYAIYGEKSSYQVTMHYQYLGEAKTLTAKAYDDGTVVLPSGFSYENAVVYGKYLAGWATAEGATEPDFDLSKNKVSGNTDLYAVYKDISVNATQGQGASIDAANAYVATQGAIGAQEVVAKVVKADSIDKNLNSKATGLLNRGNYTVSLGYSTGSESSTTQVNGSFGNLGISIPVASEDADRNFQVYWIQENGTFGGLSTSDSAQADKISVTDDGQGGKVLKFSIASYGDSMFGGNLMVCAEKTSLEKAQDTYLSKLKEYWNKLGGDNEEDGIQDNYTDDDFAKLKQAYENGEKAIKAAADEDAALAAANEAVANLLAVPTRSTLQNAKAYALDKLADEFSGYNKSNYTDANWSQLEAAYKAAKENINNAATADDVNSACNKGISAMASVSTKTASSGSSTGSGSSSDSGSGLTGSTASGSGSGLSSSGGSGLSSSSGSGLESSSGSGLTSLGSTVQQMLGAKYETVTSDLVSQKGLIATSGVYVSEVTDGGAAQKAGLEVGDVITAVNGTQVSSVEELESVLADVKAGDTVELAVDRNGKKLTLTATMDDVSSVSGLSSSSSGLGSSAYGSDADNAADALKVLRDYLPWIVLGLLVLLAAVAGLVWWLLRRRNNGSEEGLDETEGEADSQEDVNTFQF